MTHIGSHRFKKWGSVRGLKRTSLVYERLMNDIGVN